MLSPLTLFLVVLAYLLVLFALAFFAESRERSGRSIVSNPWVYSLSLAVYCTSWTFYGSVGKAASSGLSFITIYLGPTLAAALWWVVLRKVITVAKRHRITTISDFIGSRYGNSLTLSALVTVIALVGITPYLGLQMKAIIKTYEIMVGTGAGSHAAGWVIALLVGVFAVMYGARRLDASERHEGLVMAVAFESVIKLSAFLMAGGFVTYVLFDGFGDIFRRISSSGHSGLLGAGVVQPEWSSLIFLSTMAVMFLPRQFQVAVAENSDIGHVRTAMWLFPLYLLLINVFVMPVAFGGLLLGGSAAEADNFVLTIPLEQGKGALALLVFLGGFSAATGMIIVESLALSTMVMNSLAMPVLVRFNSMKGFPSIVLNTKRLAIMGCVFLGYVFAVSVGEFYTLVDMGLKSFEAVTLFAPPLLLGLYWKRGNMKGAAAGLVAGFAVWLYTLLLPALTRAGLIGKAGLSGGIFDPHALFGLAGLDKWTHSLFWGLSLNVLLYVGVSIFTSRDAAEERQARLFVEPEKVTEGPAPGGVMGVDEVEELLARHVGHGRAKEAVGRYILAGGHDRERMDTAALKGLMDEAELILAGSLGPAVASLIIRGRAVLGEEFSDTIMRMTDTLRMSREELEEANLELGLLKEFSQNIIESVPVGLATLDTGLRVTYWNREMERITGIGRDEAAGRPINTLGACMEQDVFAAGLRGGEFTCTGKGGRPATLKVTASPFHDPRGGYVMMFEDVTEKLRHEKELALASKYASIGKLTAGLSHEIGNPLASISSLVQEIQTVDSPEFAREALGTVNQHIERIARIVRSLGDFARVKSPEKIMARIEDVLERTISLTSFDKKFRKVEVVREVDAVPPIRMNPDQLQQVFLNMLLNSLDAMPDGGRITIRIKELPKTVDVSFADTGTGMDRETMERVFDPFFTTKPPGKGTGLGMSVCYGIIREHGGTISVESEKGAGTTFRMSFPKGV